MDDYSPKAFIKALERIDRSKSMREKFRDFVELAYCAYAKKTAASEERADALEERYMKVVGSYRNKDDVREYPKLLAMCALGVQEGMDYLGTVSGQLEVLDAKQGQFFTPMSVSMLMVMMTLGDLKPQLEEKNYLALDEPACGAGSMVIATAQVFHQQGFSPNLHLFVHAADINQLAYQMSFLQLSMAGVAAYVERANSLNLEHFEGAWTLAACVFRAHWGHSHFDRPERQQLQEALPVLEANALENQPLALKQLPLF